MNLFKSAYRLTASALVVAALAFPATTFPALASQQKRTVKPDGTITFLAATNGVTRIAISGGDRIKELVANDSNFEPKSNADTGDVFLRFIGQGRVGQEDGFIVTEKGHTINYRLKPKESTSETVLINLQAPAPVDVFDDSGDLGGIGSVTTSSSDGHVPAVKDAIRKAMIAHVIGRKVPKRKSGSVVGRVRHAGLTAKVIVVSAGKNGGGIKPQALATSRVVGVSVQKANLGPNERTFAVIVEQR